MITLEGLGAPRSALQDLWRCYGGVAPVVGGISDDALAEYLEADVAEVEALRSQVLSGSYAVSDEYVTAKTRGSSQQLFASMVKSNYGWKCALTGIATREFLVASHIVPWSEDESIRLDPANGICLSTFADRAFDTGYLIIREDCRVQINWSLAGADGALSEALAPFDGQKLVLPVTFPPNPEYLRRRLSAW